MWPMIFSLIHLAIHPGHIERTITKRRKTWQAHIRKTVRKNNYRLLSPITYQKMPKTECDNCGGEYYWQWEEA
ncbi:hypothetical protein MYX76_10845 [Desulfobacterota bacterium AH_259_B03_O07]|nr:hypothetical protein [Desulfobacterota bacterium AH_259_B03_O07]